jgi:uncharacterized protein YjiS (DUF1127 family)
MTTLTTNDRLFLLAAPGLRRLVTGWAESWAEFRAERAERRRITRELNSYSNSELAELGLFRHDIDAVARGIYRR